MDQKEQASNQVEIPRVVLRGPTKWRGEKGLGGVLLNVLSTGSVALVLSLVEVVSELMNKGATERPFIEDVTTALLRSVEVTATLVGVVIVFVFAIRLLGYRSEHLRETRESLVSSYLAALDQTSLNPTGPSLQITLPRNLN